LSRSCREFDLFFQALTWEGYQELSSIQKAELAGKGTRDTRHCEEALLILTFLRIAGVQWVDEFELAVDQAIAVTHMRRVSQTDGELCELEGAYLDVLLSQCDY
jgi:hypothetical protein